MQFPQHLETYLAYVRNTESPDIYHIWAYLACISAVIKRRVYFQHGHFRVFPNIYCMLIGSPGVRKSSAINIAVNLLRANTNVRILESRLTKERLMLDLAGYGDVWHHKLSQDADIRKLVEEERDSGAAELAAGFIVAEEFNAVVPVGDDDFFKVLTRLWDGGDFGDRKKNSMSVMLKNTYVTLLGANTPAGLNRALPPGTADDGFLSRVLFIYGEATKPRLAFPPPPKEEDTERLQQDFAFLDNTLVECDLSFTPAAMRILESIYIKWPSIGIPRLQYYDTRRFTHLLKLCILFHIATHWDQAIEHKIDVPTVIGSNTLLFYVEQHMGRAFGEFGKARNSDVTTRVLDSITKADGPVSVKELWAVHSPDFERMQDLFTVLQNLLSAEKIMAVHGGYLPVLRPIQADTAIHTDGELLLRLGNHFKEGKNAAN